MTNNFAHWTRAFCHLLHLRMSESGCDKSTTVVINNHSMNFKAEFDDLSLWNCKGSLTGTKRGDVRRTDAAKVVRDIAQRRARKSSSRPGVWKDWEERHLAKARRKLGPHALSAGTAGGRRSAHIAIDVIPARTELRVRRRVRTWIFRIDAVELLDAGAAAVFRRRRSLRTCHDQEHRQCHHCPPPHRLHVSVRSKKSKRLWSSAAHEALSPDALTCKRHCYMIIEGIIPQVFRHSRYSSCIHVPLLLNIRQPWKMKKRNEPWPASRDLTTKRGLIVPA